jgi:hypothetical protein
LARSRQTASPASENWDFQNPCQSAHHINVIIFVKDPSGALWQTHSDVETGTTKKTIALAPTTAAAAALGNGRKNQTHHFKDDAGTSEIIMHT